MPENKELPLFDGFVPLPYMNSYMFRTPNGRVGKLVTCKAFRAVKDKLIETEGLCVHWQDEKE